MTSGPLFGFDGQSNSLFPDGAISYAGNSYPNVVMDEIGLDHLWYLVAVGGSTYDQRRATAPANLDAHLPLRTSGVLFSEGGVTELLAGSTAAQTIAEALAYNTERRAAGWDLIIGNTVTPSTLYFTAGEEAERVAYNAAIVADPSLIGADAVADWAAIPELADSTNPTFYGDGIHYTAAGALLVAGVSLEAYRSIGD